MGEIVAAWESAAAKHGAEFIDFRGMLRDASPHRVLGPPMIVDDVHLSLEGYWLLSNLWFQAIRWRLEGQPAKPVTLGADPDVSAYVRALEPIGDVLVGNGHRHLKVGMLLFALNMLIPAAEDQHDDSARLAVGWIRTVAGLPADLPPELQAKLGEFDPENLWEYAKPPGSTRPGTPPPPNRP